MADLNDIIIAFAPTISIAVGSIILWIRAELGKRDETALKKEADTQGDALATLGLMLADRALNDARKIPELAELIDHLENLVELGVEIWSDPMGSNDEMIEVVTEAQELYKTILGQIKG